MRTLIVEGDRRADEPHYTSVCTVRVGEQCPQETRHRRVAPRSGAEAHRLYHGRQQTLRDKARFEAYIWTPARVPQGELLCHAAANVCYTAHDYTQAPIWFPQLLDALQWSLDLGVKAITVYAFSIDNFRRGAEEVEALMTLAEQKLLDLMKVSCPWQLVGIQHSYTHCKQIQQQQQPTSNTVALCKHLHCSGLIKT